MRARSPTPVVWKAPSTNFAFHPFCKFMPRIPLVGACIVSGDLTQ
jgi:hypothetical protein